MPACCRIEAKSTRSALLGLAAAVLLAPAPARAQSRSVLPLLPTDDRTLSIGAEVDGALSSSDMLAPDDAFMEAWAFALEPGRPVTIDLESGDFDTVLYVVGPGLTGTLFDDDSGGGCNSRITFTVLERGTFHVVASSLAPGETGTYRLRVSEGSSDAPAHACGDPDPAQLAALSVEGRTIAMGGQRSGRLDALAATIDGRPAQAWALTGSAGDRVSVVMESSDFDAYLYLFGPGLDAVLGDDDGAGGLNARLDATLPADGPYTVVATALGSEANGAYALRVERPLDLSELSTDGRTVEPGQTSGGVLTFGDPVVIEGRRAQAWALEGTAGRTVTIDLRSDEFDGYLYLVGPGLDEPLFDDDGGGDLNARITHTFTETGRYLVLVSALGSEATGAFTLRVTGRWAPPSRSAPPAPRAGSR